MAITVQGFGVLPHGQVAGLIEIFGELQRLKKRRREREILASLDHPHIARLIDGGTTEDGVPYFVMEFVDGQPIHRWCDEAQPERGAASRIVPHGLLRGSIRASTPRGARDLKPGNILVTNDGTVKLLDFGIAKVLADQHGAAEPDKELLETVSMLQIMTPQYASPEQAKGESITTLTDVYSLGVVLWEWSFTSC